MYGTNNEHYEGVPILATYGNVVITPKIGKCFACGKCEIGISLITNHGEGSFGHKTHLCFNCIDQIKEQL